jgi:nicotinate-nucleotide pyrophosphorylase (carboxylating)
MAVLAPWVVLDPLLRDWLREDVGRGASTTGSLYIDKALNQEAQWTVKAPGSDGRYRENSNR